MSTAPTTVIELATSHSPFLSAPEELAATIVAAFRVSHSGLIGASV